MIDISRKAEARRPLASRDARLSRMLMERLLETPATPNQISLASIGFAALGAAALLAGVQHPFFYLAGALFIQLRLLCNLLDGMVAVEGGRGGPTGQLFNEIPDRIADTLLIVAAGYAAGVPAIGWLAALLAALTAYIRALGGALGFPQDFSGILSKPRRMALLTAACVLASIESWFGGPGWTMPVAVTLLAAGAFVTCATRTMALARKLEGA